MEAFIGYGHDDKPTNGWREWSNHVLLELEALRADHKAQVEELTKARIEIGSLRTIIDQVTPLVDKTETNTIEIASLKSESRSRSLAFGSIAGGLVSIIGYLIEKFL